MVTTMSVSISGSCCSGLSRPLANVVAAATSSPAHMFLGSVVAAGPFSHEPNRTPLLPVVPFLQAMMNRIAYQRVRESLQRGHQVMVFVHARKDTVRTAEVIISAASF